MHGLVISKSLIAIITLGYKELGESSWGTGRTWESRGEFCLFMSLPTTCNQSIHPLGVAN